MSSPVATLETRVKCVVSDLDVISKQPSDRLQSMLSTTSLSQANSGVTLIGEKLLVETLKFLGIRFDEIILKQSRRRRRRRMRLSILPARDMICSALPGKGQMCKIVPKRVWQLDARLRSRMQSAMPGGS